MNTTESRPLALVTGASTGIGYQLARCCAEHGYDLLITANEPKIYEAAHELRATGVRVGALQTDLATRGGVDRFYSAAQGRPIEALLANVGAGLGGAFLDQQFEEVRRVIDTNVTGILFLLHKVAFDMRARGRGRILLTGSTAGLFRGTFQAVYGGTKGFLHSFATELREELRDSGVTVTCLMPGPAEAELFEHAAVEHTKLGGQRTEARADVARIGFAAMQCGDGDVISEWKDELQVTAAAVLAKQHRKIPEPGSTGERH